MLSRKRKLVPFSREDAFKEKEAFYSKKRFFSSYVIEDQRLITGQNPWSPEAIDSKTGGSRMKHEIKIEVQKCIGCGQCIKDCPEQNIRLIQNKAQIQSQNCMKCGHCVAICPQNAVSMTGFDQEPIKCDQKEMDPKEFLYTIQTNRSVRQFQKKEIPNNVIQDLQEAARYMPTAKNMRDVELIFLQKEQEQAEEIAVHLFRRLLKGLNLFSKRYRDFLIDDHFFFKKAPLVVVVVGKDKTNAVLATSAMALMAKAHGLGVLYSGFFTLAAHTSIKLKRMLKIPKGKKVQITLVIGYPSIRYARGVQREALHVQSR